MCIRRHLALVVIIIIPCRVHDKHACMTFSTVILYQDAQGAHLVAISPVANLLKQIVVCHITIPRHP